MERTRKQMVSVGIAGSFGAILRFLLYELGEQSIGIEHASVTLLINIIGTFLLSFLSVVAIRQFAHTLVENDLLLGAFLGSFTTFSAFVNDSVSFGDGSIPTVDPVLLFGSIGVALIFAFLGTILGRYIHNLTGRNAPKESGGEYREESRDEDRKGNRKENREGDRELNPEGEPKGNPDRIRDGEPKHSQGAEQA